MSQKSGIASEAKPDPIADSLVATLGAATRGHKIAVWILSLVALWGLGCYIYQLCVGLAATSLDNTVSWGVYIVNFIFFIGISMAGTLISAILRLTGAGWRKPITRLAEAITLFALLIAAPMILIDMGRPDRLLYVLIYGRLQSPILWDVLSLSTYLIGSLIYLYLPLIPDLAILRDRSEFSSFRQRIYRVLSLGWKGTPPQVKALEQSISVMAVVIIPVAVSIHTVTAWIFGMTLRPGWHSTIIGPDFVVGALYSGIAAVIVAMALFRKFFNLGQYLTEVHFKNLGTLLLVAGITYLYFTVNNFIGPAYVTQIEDSELLFSLFNSRFARLFWFLITAGIILPCLILALPPLRTIKGIVVASVLVNIGMWIMRYLIIVPTLSAPFMPVTQSSPQYFPSVVEAAITAAGFAVFALLYFFFSKMFPIISIWELRGDAHVEQPSESRSGAISNEPLTE